MKTKKIVACIFTLCFFAGIFAGTAVHTEENYSLNISYTDNIVPGDAIFVRMSIGPGKSKKKLKAEIEKQAVLEFYQKKKLIESAPFYQIAENKKTTAVDFLAGVPVSLWLTDDEFTVKVVYKLGDEDLKEFIIPISFKSREFNKEIIELNDKNTEIRSDNSPERMKQIEKLNNILFTSQKEDIFDLKAFTSPSLTDYHTAYFGDQRVYKYSNGKSSSSAHYGNDYRASEGTDVYACADGKVVLAEWRITTGYSVVVEHLPGLYSLYYHFSKMEVKEGDFIKRGSVLGKAGSTGLATGPHIHWEIRLNGGAVRPEFFMGNFSFESFN